MEERKRKYFQLKIAVLLFLTLLTWGYSIYYGRENAVFKGEVSVRYDEPTIDYASIRKVIEAQEKETEASLLPAISLWNRDRDITITNADELSEVKVDLIRMRGDMSAVEKEHMLRGNLVLSDDMRGCVIDKVTAYALYKSYDIIGMTILLDDTRYYIRGILDTSAKRMLIQEEKPEEKYAYLEFVYPMDKDSTKTRLSNDLGLLTKNFLSQYGFGESRVIVDKDFCVDSLKIVYNLPGWFLVLLIIINMLKTLRNTRKVPVIWRINFLCMVTITVLLAWLVELRFHFPERFVPTRWSDFDFWTQKFKEIQEVFIQFYSIIPVSNDSFFKWYCYGCIISTLLSMMFCIVLQGKWNRYVDLDQSNGKRIWGIYLCILVVTFLSLFALSLFNRGIVPTRSYLTIIPGYVAIWLLTREVGEYMRRFEEEIVSS